MKKTVHIHFRSGKVESFPCRPEADAMSCSEVAEYMYDKLFSVSTIFHFENMMFERSAVEYIKVTETE